MVVEDGPALGVEVQAHPRDVALDHGDGRRAVLGLRADERTRGEGGGEREDHGHRGGDGGGPAYAPAAPGVGGQPYRLVQPEAAQGDGEAEDRGAAEGGERQERAVGLAEGDLAPGKPSNGTRARAASPAIHRAAAHSGQPGSRDTSAAPAPTRPTKRASMATSATHGPGPTSTPVHTSSGSRNPSPKT